MPANERAIKGGKNKKTTDDVIPGKEKSKDRRESSLPSKQSGNSGDNKDKGSEKPKKKN